MLCKCMLINLVCGLTWRVVQGSSTAAIIAHEERGRYRSVEDRTDRLKSLGLFLLAKHSVAASFVGPSRPVNFAGSLPRALSRPVTPSRSAEPHADAMTQSNVGRRTLLAGVGSGAAAVFVEQLSPRAAEAAGTSSNQGNEVRGINAGIPRDANGIDRLLKSQGFSTFGEIPGGLNPYVGYIGQASPANIDGQKVKERAFASTLLVRFLYPNLWITEFPSITDNGEGGNLGANNYQKGDSATFLSLPLPKGEKLQDLKKDFFKDWLSSQMTKDVLEDVKIKKVTPVTQPDGTEMLILNTQYTLLTRAGFEVTRTGISGVMVASGAVVGLALTTTADRYKKFEDAFKACADSFRAYEVKKPDFKLDGKL